MGGQRQGEDEPRQPDEWREREKSAVGNGSESAVGPGQREQTYKQDINQRGYPESVPQQPFKTAVAAPAEKDIAGHQGGDAHHNIVVEPFESHLQRHVPSL